MKEGVKRGEFDVGEDNDDTQRVVAGWMGGWVLGLIDSIHSRCFKRNRPGLRAASAASEASSGGASSPRMADRMHVQRRLVVATQGMRSHMGEKVKLNIVAGTHTFQSATRSSLQFFLSVGCWVLGGAMGRGGEGAAVERAKRSE